MAARAKLSSPLPVLDGPKPPRRKRALFSVRKGERAAKEKAARSAHGRGLGLVGGLFALVLILSPVGAAPNTNENPSPAEAVRTAALALLSAIEALAEAERASDRIGALTEVIRAHERGLTTLREGLDALRAEQAALERLLAESADTGTELLSALLTLGRVNPPFALAHSEGILAAVQATILARDALPALAAKAEALEERIVAFAELRALETEAEAVLERARLSLEEARLTFLQAIDHSRPRPPELSFDEARLLALLQSAATLEQFARALDQLSPPRAEVGSGFAQAKGRLPLPVAGTLLPPGSSADASHAGQHALVLATLPGALVIAPWAGRVRFVGPLLDQPNVLVLEPETDYVLILSGLGTIFPQIGEVVEAHAPLGLMPGGDVSEKGKAGPDEPPAARSAGSRGERLVENSERLSVELWHAGHPIDPKDWFALNDGPPAPEPAEGFGRP